LSKIAEELRDVAACVKTAWVKADLGMIEASDVVALLRGALYVEQQEARIAELEAGLRAMVAVEPIYSTGPVDNRYCFYSCDWDEYTSEVHSPDCPWLVAKGLLDG
jgi:hypothetical protein